MKIFVTGGSGFVGQHFISELSACLSPSDQIFLLARGGQSIKTPDARFQVLPGSLADIDRHREVLQQCEYVFHLAANAAFAGGADTEFSNVQGTSNLLGTLTNSRHLLNFIFISSIGAVDRDSQDSLNNPLGVQSRPHPRSAYGHSKLAGERLVKNSGLPFTIIRPGWVYGKGMRKGSHLNNFVSLAAAKSWVSRLNWPGQVSLIEVRDLARALTGALGNSRIIGKTYFAALETLSVGEIFRQIYRGLGTDRGSGINFPPATAILSRLHRFLPLRLCILLFNYLSADENLFRSDFTISSSTPFCNGVSKVIAENSDARGYWVITGANSGIGYALARQLSAAGENLFLIDKASESFSEFPQAIARQIDLTDENALHQVAGEISQLPIKTLINNAGVGFKGKVTDLTLAQMKAMVTVNILVPLNLVNLLQEKMRHCGTTIVNIGSSAGFHPLPGMSVYAASKSFVIHWSEALRQELKKTNAVITFSPSGTNTNFQKAAGVANHGGKGLLNPEAVARSILASVGGSQGHVTLGLKGKILNRVIGFLPRSKRAAVMGRLFASLR